MDKKIEIVYIDDTIDPILSKYLFVTYKKNYSEIDFKPHNDFTFLIKELQNRRANIVIIDSRLFQNNEKERRKFSGEEFKIILQKFLPFVETIIISQNGDENKIGMLEKFRTGRGVKLDDAIAYYNKNLRGKINEAVLAIERIDIIAEELMKNPQIDKMLKEQIQNAIDGLEPYSELKKNDVDLLIKAFTELKDKYHE